jgi:hypothetical protein
MFAHTLQREVNLLNIISTVIILAMIISPSMIYSISFQMSIFAFFGIIIFYPIFNDFFIIFSNSKSKIARYIIRSIAMTFSASIILYFIVAYYFGTLSIVSPLVNIVVVPLFSFGLTFSVIAILFSYVYFPLGEIYSYCGELFFKLCVNIAEFAANFSFSAISNNQYLTLIAALTSIFLIYIFASRKKAQLIFRLVVSLLFIPTIFFLMSKNQNEVKIYPKESYCVLSIPLGNNEKFVWIADRKPMQKYYNDLSLINFFNSNNDIKCVGISGDWGKEFVSKNLQNTKIKIRELSFPEQRELEKNFLDGKYISQIINTN